MCEEWDKDKVRKIVLGSKIIQFHPSVLPNIFQHHDQYCIKEPQPSTVLNVEAILRIL